jgi:general secretion pathway protein G
MKKSEQRWRNLRAGFTLIEILLVVVIIGMLATLVAVNVPKQMEKARVNKAKADIRGLGVALNSYYMDKGKFPGSLGDLTSGDDPYLEGDVPNDPWGGQYQYAFPGSHRPYKYDLQCTSPDGKNIANFNMDQKESTP